MPFRSGYQPIVGVVGGNERHDRAPFARQQSNEAFQPTTFYADEVLVNIGETAQGNGRKNRSSSRSSAPGGDDLYQQSSSSSALAPAAASRWSHIDNLDDFFARVYEYHQRHGFVCMFLSDCFELIQFIFVVVFSSFLLECVDYRILFKEAAPRNFNASQVPPRKLTLVDAIRPNCAANFDGWLIICLILAAAFWLHRFIRVIFKTNRSWEMRQFFNEVLKIPDGDLENLTWHEVQRRLRDAQCDHQLCIHKRELTELDIYQRILRRKNYLVAMVNKGLLPPKFCLPLFGENAGITFFTNFFKLNLELLFFASPWSPWENHWQLKADYKRREKRQELTEKMRRVVLYLGLFDLILSPVIVVWQILYSFFFYAELVKREPGSLGARRWSIFGRYYFRHLNELDHELDARLCRAYRPAQYYMDMFISSVGEVLAKNVAFFAGALFAVLVILSVYDEDVLQVEHVLTAITGLGLVIAVCKVFIPDENLVWCPEMMMAGILSQVHYMPEHWRGQAHAELVREEFSQLFQYKATFVLEELLSPIVTPFVLLFWLRPRCSEFIDFFRKFTLEVPGLGDVCSFAQMDVQKHGDPAWHPLDPPNRFKPPSAPGLREPDDVRVPADYGKTEMSLVHFAITNPGWEPPRGSGAGMTQRFLQTLRREALKDANTLREHQLTGVFDNALLQSMGSLGIPPSFGFLGGVHNMFPSAPFQGPQLKGQGVNKAEGPLYASAAVGSGLVSTMNPADLTSQQQPSLSSVLMSSRFIAANQHQLGGPVAFGGMTESTAAEMSLNAMYMHELHRRKTLAPSDGAIGSAAEGTSADGEGEDGTAAEGQTEREDLWDVPPGTNGQQEGQSPSQMLRLRSPEEDDTPPHCFDST